MRTTSKKANQKVSIWGGICRVVGKVNRCGVVSFRTPTRQFMVESGEDLPEAAGLQ